MKLCRLLLKVLTHGLGPVALLAGTSSRAADPAPGYSLYQSNQVSWLRDPAGHAYFSLGVSCVNQGVSRQDYDVLNPAYAAWRFYPSPGEWAEDTLSRLRSWQFNTLGGWSDITALKGSSRLDFHLTPVLHMGSTAGAPWWDMWDPKITGRMEDVAREQILAVRDHPRLVGYFSDNELGWWNATLFKMTLEHAPTSGQRQRLLQLLRDAYHSDWSRLQSDFQPEGAGNWEELDQRGKLFLRPGGKGVQVMRRFLALIADRYYSLVRDIIRKYDTRALLLGDRYQSFYYPEVAQACGKYMDVVSSNLNAQWNDGTFLRSYLQTLHDLTHRPILISEIYMAATDNRSGNRNDHGVFPVVPTQRERAAGFSRTLKELLRLPYVVGVDWFQYSDEPSHGRPDGENFNFGLVDIHNQPYDKVTHVVSALDPVQLRRDVVSRPDATQGIPRAPRDPLAEFQPNLALKSWNRERGFVPSATSYPQADLYLCWSPEALYVGLYCLDIVEEAYYRDPNIPKQDRAQWEFRVPNCESNVLAFIGAGREPLVSDPQVEIKNLSGEFLNVRNIAAVRLPASLFAKTRFRSGDRIHFLSTLSTHCQSHRIEWNGAFTLSAR